MGGVEEGRGRKGEEEVGGVEKGRGRKGEGGRERKEWGKKCQERACIVPVYLPCSHGQE